MEEFSIVGSDEDEVIARNNLLVCFFGQTSVRDWAVAGSRCFQEWLEIVPDKALRWTLTGATASQYAARNARSIERCQALLDGARTKSKLASFELLGPGRYAPDFSISWKAQPESTEEEDSEFTNFVEMRFPASFLESYGSESFVKWASARARELPYDSGYAAISLVSHEMVVDEAGESIAPLALRHFGYDVSENRGTSFTLGHRCRGAQWLTFLGTSLITTLGGSKQVTAALAKDYKVAASDNGLAVLTSSVPEIGDTNRKKLVQGLRPLAKLLEPVTYFGDDGLDDLFMDDEEKRERWERRFLV